MSPGSIVFTGKMLAIPNCADSSSLGNQHHDGECHATNSAPWSWGGGHTYNQFLMGCEPAQEGDGCTSGKLEVGTGEAVEKREWHFLHHQGCVYVRLLFKADHSLALNRKQEPFQPVLPGMMLQCCHSARTEGVPRYLSGLIVVLYLPQISAACLSNSFPRDQISHHHRGGADF